MSDLAVDKLTRGELDEAFRIGLMVVDNCHHFRKKNVSAQKLLEACGVLPYWALASHLSLRDDLMSAMFEYYGFPMADTKEHVGSVNKDGELFYPGDPVSYPYISIFGRKQIIHIYRSAMIACLDRTSGALLTYTRMD